MGRALLLTGSDLASVEVGAFDPGIPGPGQVRLRMCAVSLGLRDYKVASGAYRFGAAVRPLVLGAEGVGVIEGLGPGVEDFQTGDRVLPCFAPLWRTDDARPADMLTSRGGSDRHGLTARSVVVEAGELALAPAGLSDIEAACLPFAGVAAYRATQAVGAGDVVIIQGTDGLQLWAAGFAAARGARVFAVAQDPATETRLVALGITPLERDADARWSRSVLALTGNRGADLVIDAGADGSMRQAARAVRPGGEIAVIGAAGPDVAAPAVWLLSHNLTVRGVFAGSLADLADAAVFCQANGVRPVIETVTPLEDAPRVLANLPNRERFGKVVITLGA